MIPEEILRKHWDKVEKGYFDRNRKNIDEDGYVRVPFGWKTTKKGTRLLEKNGYYLFRPKTLSVINL